MSIYIRKAVYAAAASVALSACAATGGDFEATPPQEVAQLAGGGTNDAVLNQAARREADNILVGYPAVCQRKECAGPQMAHHELLRDSAMLLAAMKLLHQAMLSADAGSERTRLMSLVRTRLPQLRARVAVTRMDLNDLGLWKVDFDLLETAHEQLDRADIMARRLEHVLAQYDSGGPTQMRLVFVSTAGQPN